jgi:DNA polymerase-3 subunit gamma/tau
LARLRVVDDRTFEVITSSGLERQFVDKQRNELFEFLRRELHHRSLQFNVIIEENSADRPPVEIPLSSREQYQKMCEQYPLVRELKERLKLDLDY